MKKQLPKEMDLSRVLKSLRTSADGEKALEASLSHPDPAHRLPAFTDILGLWCKWLPSEEIASNVIDNPFPFPVTTMGERQESRNIWRLELEKRETTLSDPCKQVLRFYNDWKAWDASFSSTKLRPGYFRTATTWRAIFHRAFDDTTRYLKYTEGAGLWELYGFYIPCHIGVNATSLRQAEENIKSGHNKSRDSASLPEGLDPLFTERAYIYAENVPKFVKEMELRRPSDGKFSYEDVWWMMMMRLHAWTMCVEWVDREDVVLSSEHYNNPARVYIL